MFVVQHRKIFYGVSGILIAISLIALFRFGLTFGIEFRGGSILEVEYSAARPDISVVTKALKPLKLEESVRTTGTSGYIIRMRDLTEPEHSSVLKGLDIGGKGEVTQKRYDSIGPILGVESARKSFTSIILVMVGIVLFVTYAFRQVSKPIASWKYGIVTIISLFHDIIVPAGFFSILGHYRGFEADTLFITALLVILGFSVHDTIVVFDRVRENLKMASGDTFEHTVGKSINQTFARSINTSLTVLLSLVVLYFIGPESTKLFSLALFVGIIAGTYSSIFLGSPLLVTLEKMQKK